MILLFVVLASLIVAFCWWGNLKRPLLSASEDLIPNQLMTTYPVVFLAGKKSIFYFMNYWNKLPERMKEHGYEVNEWTLPWRASSAIERQLLNNLNEAQRKGQSFHLIVDASMLNELKFLADLGHPAIQSLNLVGAEISTDLGSVSLKPYKTPIRAHKISGLSPQKGWTQSLLRLHKFLTRPKFEPQVIGATTDQSKIEAYYLSLLSELAVLDLRS